MKTQFLLQAFLIALLSCNAVAAGEGKRSIREGLAQAGISGGLIVCFGCDAQMLTDAAGLGDGFLVHGLSRNTDRVVQVRQRLQEQGCYGRVAISRFHGDRLPYADNLVNAIVSQDPFGIYPDELMRVLAPGGVLLIPRDGPWAQQERKPLSQRQDDWSHYLYNGSGNAVSHDHEVGPAEHLRWIAEPRWARGHETLASVSAMVSSGGRVFSVLDEGPIASVSLPADWVLVARDAFNGVLLWKLPIPSWEDHLVPFRDGPNQLPRRLVAVGGTVYVTLGYDAPISAIDAASGEIRHTYSDTDRAEEIVVDQGRLYAVLGSDVQPGTETADRRGESTPPPVSKTVVALDAESGETLWRKQDRDTTNLMTMTLACADGGLFFQNDRVVVRLNSTTGKQTWRSKLPAAVERHGWSSPTLVVADGVVLIADTRPDQLEDRENGNQEIMKKRLSHGGMPAEIVALDAATGKQLWSAPTRDNFHVPTDVFVVDGQVWTGETSLGEDVGFPEGRDLRSGQVTTRLNVNQVVNGHHRCYRNKATEKFLILGRRNIEFLDVRADTFRIDNFVRGGCSYGIMPANGLTYVPSHSCACTMDIKLNGFLALAPAANNHPTSKAGRLEKGPAYSARIAPPAYDAIDWPTYRGNSARGGATKADLALPLASAWNCQVGGRLSAPVLAEGCIFVAEIDAHRVLALDADSGRELWSYTTNARVDSPPTIHAGLALFGSADGWVYAVSAVTGELAWRFHAAADQRMIVAHDQLESAWPVHGSVLVDRGELYCAAGRSTFLDGGIRLCKLDAATGRLLAERVLDGKQNRDETGTKVLPDVLSCDDEYLFMRGARYRRDDLSDADKTPHLWSWIGMLDDTWWHRGFWIHGEKYNNGWSGWWVTGNIRPAGRLLVVQGDAIYGFGRSHYPSGNAGQWNSGEYYRLFATTKDFEKIDPKDADGKSYRRGTGPQRSVVGCNWSEKADFAARTLTVAHNTLFAAGPLGDTHLALDAYRGESGTVLRAYSTSDGSQLAEYPLASPPVYDGVAIGSGRLVVTLTDGSVTCYRSAD